MRLKLIQDEGQFVDLGENIFLTKTDIKKNYIVFESLSNKTIKIFVAVTL